VLGDTLTLTLSRRERGRLRIGELDYAAFDFFGGI
jgi:hypothetical protein